MIKSGQKIYTRVKDKRIGIKRSARASPWGGGYDVSRCLRCYYYGGSLIRTCDYILITGQRRPCPPGSYCSVYKEGVRDTQKLNWLFLGGGQ